MGNRLNQALSATKIREHGDHLSTERPCMGNKFHSPRPLTTSSITVKKGQTVDLCGTCADNFTAYLILAKSYPGELPWELAREYGNTIRRFGEIAVRAEKETTEPDVQSV